MVQDLGSGDGVWLGMSNTLPAFTVKNAVNVTLRDPKLPGGIGLRLSPSNLNNFPHLNLCKFWRTAALSSLAVHILNIVKVRAKKQVIWVCAFRIVAFVKHVETVWNVSKMNHPAKSVGIFEPVNQRGSVTNYSIPFFMETAVPIPAPMGFFYLGPKAFNDGFGISFINEKLKCIFSLHIKLGLSAALQDVSASLRQFFYPISDPIANQI